MASFIVIVAGLVLIIIIAIIVLIYKIRYYSKCTASATATIYTSERVGTSFSSPMIYKARYRYNKKVYKTSFHTSLPHFIERETLQIYVNPDKPEQNTLRKNREYFHISFLIGFCSLAIYCIVKYIIPYV
jgi:hypothetical protein